MDRKEKPRRRSRYANEGEVSDRDAAALETPTGSTAPDFAVTASGVAVPRSELTAHHEAGTGAEETSDGLDANAEAIRRGAEDVPIAPADESPAEEQSDDVPVFDRADRPDRV